MAFNTYAPDRQAGEQADQGKKRRGRRPNGGPPKTNGKPTNGATLGFEQTLWLAADKLRESWLHRVFTAARRESSD